VGSAGGLVCVESVAGECHEKFRKLEGLERLGMNTLIKRFLVGVFGRDRISFDDCETPWQPLVTDGAVTQGLHWNDRFCPRVYCVFIMIPSDPITWGPGPSLLCFPMNIDSSPRSKIAAPNIQQLRRCTKIIKTKKVWRIRASIIARL
jgi:hypothetical protein